MTRRPPGPVECHWGAPLQVRPVSGSRPLLRGIHARRSRRIRRHSGWPLKFLSRSDSVVIAQPWPWSTKRTPRRGASGRHPLVCRAPRLRGGTGPALPRGEEYRTTVTLFSGGEEEFVLPLVECLVREPPFAVRMGIQEPPVLPIRNRSRHFYPQLGPAAAARTVGNGVRSSRLAIANSKSE